MTSKSRNHQIRKPRKSQVSSAFEEHWIGVHGGRLRYLAQGNGPALLLLHGIVASSFSFRLVAPELAQEFRVYIPDLRIAGSDASLQSTARGLIEFLDHAGIDSAFVLGSSHGGAVAMELAAVAPERIRQLILVSPANPFARNYHRIVKFYLTSAGGAFIRLAPLAPLWLWDYAMRRMCGDTSRLLPDMSNGYREPLRESGMTAHIRSSLTTFIAEVDALGPKLAKLNKIRTLLIWGDRDPVVELDSGRALQTALQAEMTIMPGIGHLPYEENPEEFTRIVREYLHRVIRPDHRVIGPPGHPVIRSSGEVKTDADCADSSPADFADL